jgi:hypothetical protein
MTPNHFPEVNPIIVSWMKRSPDANDGGSEDTVRSVRENVGGGWGEIDREVMTDYQKLFGMRPKILM